MYLPAIDNRGAPGLPGSQAFHGNLRQGGFAGGPMPSSVAQVPGMPELFAFAAALRRKMHESGVTETSSDLPFTTVEQDDSRAAERAAAPRTLIATSFFALSAPLHRLVHPFGYKNGAIKAQRQARLMTSGPRVSPQAAFPLGVARRRKHVNPSISAGVGDCGPCLASFDRRRPVATEGTVRERRSWASTIRLTRRRPSAPAEPRPTARVPAS